MAFQIAQQQQDILYISMEMGEEEIYERHISRISYQLFWNDEKNRHKAKTVHSMIQEGKTAALKESGAIKYTADVCLGLQHANMEQIKNGTSTGKAEKTIRQMKRKSERDMEIVILKNRNGKINWRGIVLFILCYVSSFYNI